MAIGVTKVNLFGFRTHEGVFLKSARLDVTGIVVGANTVPHGLKDRNGNGIAPLTVGIEPTSTVPPYETSAADATNIYITGPTSAGTTCSIYVEWGD